jgi:pyruvate formate lyase activating enzyme
MTVEEVMEELEKDRPFYNQSGGGVTFSGGDPLVQHEFTLELLKESKRRRFHTCLETEGHAAWPILEKMLPYVDMMLYDIKHMDSEKHREYTGVGNELILKNLSKLAAYGAPPLIVRTPIVPGYTDSRQNMEAIAEFVSQLGPSVVQYQLLPYFAIMKEKYTALGLNYDLPTQRPSKEEMVELVELMRSRGIPAIVGAYQEIKAPTQKQLLVSRSLSD